MAAIDTEDAGRDHHVKVTEATCISAAVFGRTSHNGVASNIASANPLAGSSSAEASHFQGLTHIHAPGLAIDIS